MSEKIQKPEKTYLYEDPEQRSNRLALFVKINLIFMVLFLIAGVYRYNLYAQLSSGIAITQEAIEQVDAVNGILGLVYLIILIVTIVLYCKWVYRIANNALSFKPTEFTETPGWVVGWYFIPFANIFVPYIQIKKIYKISKNPTNWQNEKSSSKMLWWWLSWIISGSLSNGAARLEFKYPDNIEMIKLASAIDIASSIISIISCYLLILVINEILIAQKSKKTT